MNVSLAFFFYLHFQVHKLKEDDSLSEYLWLLLCNDFLDKELISTFSEVMTLLCYLYGFVSKSHKKTKISYIMKKCSPLSDFLTYLSHVELHILDNQTNFNISQI